jgi:hypothetical protein
MAKDGECNILDRKYRDITVESIEQTLGLFDNLGDYIFRGHRKKEWGLQTTFERALEGVPVQHRRKLERKVVVEFRRRAQHYLANLPAEDQQLEWLALMQHHGCPTRLLDFTRSHYIALFFAVEDADSDSAVWGVNRTFYESRPGVPASEDHLHSTYNEDAEKRVNKILSSPDEQEWNPGVLLVEPYRMNERLSIQQGLFLFPEDLKTSFEENLCSRQGAKSLDELGQQEGTPIVVKIVIPERLHLRTCMKTSIRRMV